MSRFSVLDSMNSVAFSRDLDVYVDRCGLRAALPASGYLARSGRAGVLVCLLSSLLPDVHVSISLYVLACGN